MTEYRFSGNLVISNYLKLLRFDEWLPQTSMFIIIGYILTRISILSHIIIILIAFLSFLLISSSSHVINDYFDRESDKKKKNNRNPISTGLVSEKSAIILSTVPAVLGLGISYFLLPIPVFFLSLVAIALTIIYSAPPLRMKERFVLDIIGFCPIISVLFLFGYVLFREINFPITMLAFDFFILNIIVELLQEIRDYNADKKCGFKTTVIKIGIKNSIKLTRIIIISFIVMFSLTVYLYFPLYFLLPMLSLVPLVRFIFSKNIETTVLDIKIISNYTRKCSLILVPILLIIVPLWYGLI